MNPVLALPAEDTHALDFKLPDARAAPSPPETRGIARDGVRLLVNGHGSREVRHARFHDLPRFLAPRDLLVVNASATMNAALDAVREDGEQIVVHLSAALEDGLWAIELRRIAPQGTVPLLDARAGERILLPGNAHAALIEPWVAPGTRGVRLWAADMPADAQCLARRAGRPIRYAYVRESWPIGYYHTVFAREPGSAEMPSAGRPFTPALLARLERHGVRTTAVVLHTGVSSQESDERPYPERFRVPAETAHAVNRARDEGGRVIAVGTTVVRALETVASVNGTMHPGEGWTDLVVGPSRVIRSVDAMITGLHPPRATHLAMLEALAGPRAVALAYEAALRQGYEWHEFGDAHLLFGRMARRQG